MATTVSWNMRFTTREIDDQLKLRVWTSKTPTDPTPMGSLCFTNTKPTTKLTNIKVVYWIPVDNVIFRRINASTTAWTMLSEDYALKPQYLDGIKFTAYTTRFQGTITARTGTTCFPPFAYESVQDVTSKPPYAAFELYATIDGQNGHWGPVEFAIP
ncbi:hypothetical protein [Devriesea agamarum]|uniref:hypothetical protein n=1 Tax=Devriesea agamarum TaxID=472569 RepID=UPI0012EE9954|nr:hypothetical protein [Devriesea agamarum]